MRLAVTTHAIERWSELTDPPLAYRVSKDELVDACAPTTARERVGVTRRGQVVYRVLNPREAYLVCKVRGDAALRGAVAGGIVVTVLPRELWLHEEFDEATEILEAWEDWQTMLPPPGHKSKREPGPDRPAPIRTAPPAPPAVLRAAVLGDGPGLGSDDAQQCADWRSWAWTVGTIERDRRIAEHYRNEREDVGQRAEVLRVAFKVAAGHATVDELRAIIEAHLPGAIAGARERRAAG